MVKRSKSKAPPLVDAISRIKQVQEKEKKKVEKEECEGERSGR